MFFPPLLMISLMGAGTVAAGYAYHRKNRKRHPEDYPRFYGRGEYKGHGRRKQFYDEDYLEFEDEYDIEEDYFDDRPEPMSRRNPNDVSLFDSEIEEYGNYAMRSRMTRYAKRKMNNLYGYRASIWDLEGFL